MIEKLERLIDEIFVTILTVFFKVLSKIQRVFLMFNYLKIKQLIHKFTQR